MTRACDISSRVSACVTGTATVIRYPLKQSSGTFLNEMERVISAHNLALRIEQPPHWYREILRRVTIAQSTHVTFKALEKLRIKRGPAISCLWVYLDANTSFYIWPATHDAVKSLKIDIWTNRSFIVPPRIVFNHRYNFPPLAHTDLIIFCFGFTFFFICPFCTSVVIHLTYAWIYYPLYRFSHLKFCFHFSIWKFCNLRHWNYWQILCLHPA